MLYIKADKLSMIKLRNWQNGEYTQNYTEGKETLKNIVKKRADLSLFVEGDSSD